MCIRDSDRICDRGPNADGELLENRSRTPSLPRHPQVCSHDLRRERSAKGREIDELGYRCNIACLNGAGQPIHGEERPYGISQPKDQKACADSYRPSHRRDATLTKIELGTSSVSYTHL